MENKNDVSLLCLPVVQLLQGGHLIQVDLLLPSLPVPRGGQGGRADLGLPLVLSIHQLQVDPQLQQDPGN